MKITSSRPSNKPSVFTSSETSVLINAPEASNWKIPLSVGNDQLSTVRTERDDQNDGSPESIKQEIHSWDGSGHIIEVYTTVDSDGNTTTDWTETSSYSYDGSQNLISITTAIDALGDGSVEDVNTTTASYNSNILVNSSKVENIGNDGSIEYQMDSYPMFNANGMPTLASPTSPDRPITLPVQSELLH